MTEPYNTGHYFKKNFGSKCNSIFAQINIMFRNSIIMIALLSIACTSIGQNKPLRVAVVGLTHAHVHWILGRDNNKGDIEMVGIAEPNRELAERFSKQHKYKMDIVYATMEEMIEKTKPEAVLAFNSIYEHLKVVEYCAPRGIHVMVEKPLAVSADHVNKMLALAKKHKIHLLTNYETTWYSTNELAHSIVMDKKAVGDIRKIVFYTGHQGPIEIGCNKEFLDWLTDPVQNGAGALTDFGCYGANLATWFMNGETPMTVSAVTQQIKPDKYPKVDDEATILLTYKKAQVIIQASWNWPYGRKEMELYGNKGYVFCKTGSKMSVKEDGKKSEEMNDLPPLPPGRDDPFAYLANVIRGNIQLKPFDLSSPDNNEIVVKILAAAKIAATTGKTINWDQHYKSSKK
jgi:predicted dehydrogenase